MNGGNQRDVRPPKVISINLFNHDYYIILTIFYQESTEIRSESESLYKSFYNTDCVK